MAGAVRGSTEGESPPVRGRRPSTSKFETPRLPRSDALPASPGCARSRSTGASGALGLGFRAGPRIDVPGVLEGSALGDADDDGDLDLLVVALSTRSEPVLLRNDGGGALGEPELLSSIGPAAAIVAVTDIDGDGATEIVLVAGDWLRIYRLNDAAQLLDTPLDRGVRAIDADADGDLDLVHHDSYSGRHVFVVAQNRSR